MKKQISLFIIVIIFLVSCSNDEREFQKSIFVEDSEFPGLPKYSELGYNTFGAYYDREVFASGQVTPIKVSVQDGETTINFIGEKNYKELSLAVKLRDLNCSSYTDLIALKGKVLDLTDPAYQITLRTDSKDNQAQIIKGTLSFRSVKNVSVDTKQIEIILSGEFDLQVIIDRQPVTISDGRFDLGVGSTNFYKL